MNILNALAIHCPGAVYTVQDTSRPYETLVWHEENTIPKPTLAELEAVIKAYSYQEQRRFEYPPLTDLADAIVHKELGNPVPMQEYIEKCVAVKKRIPKGE